MRMWHDKNRQQEFASLAAHTKDSSPNIVSNIKQIRANWLIAVPLKIQGELKLFDSLKYS